MEKGKALHEVIHRFLRRVQNIHTWLNYLPIVFFLPVSHAWFRFLALFMIIPISMVFTVGHIHMPNKPALGYSMYRTNPDLYVYGNLSINASDESMLKGYNIIFSGSGNHFLNICTNSSISCETIVNSGGKLVIRNGGSADNIQICNSTFNFTGYFMLRNSSIRMYKTFVGGTAGICFINDHVSSYYSTFRNEKSLNSAGIYNVSTLSQNGQPISSNSSYMFDYSTLPGYNYPVSSIALCLNYTMENSPNPVYMKFELSSSMVFSKNLCIENRAGRFRAEYNLTNPWFLSGFSTGKEIPVAFNMSPDSKLTIWHGAICFLSNSTINHTGIYHNFIVLSRSDLYSVCSTFTGNEGTLEKGGYFNSSRTGLYMVNDSGATLVDSGFTGAQKYVEGTYSPVVKGRNSVLEVWKSSSIFVSTHQSTYCQKNITFTGMNDNYTKVKENALNVSCIKGKEIIGSGMLLQYFSENCSQIFSSYRYSIYGNERYLSLQEGTVFTITGIIQHLYFNNTSTINVTLSETYTNNDTITHLELKSLYGKSSSIYIRILLNYSGEKRENNFQLNNLSLNKSFCMKMSLARNHNVNESYVKVNWIISYNNSLFTENVSGNENLPVERYNYTYNLTECGIPSGQEWSIIVQNFSYTTMQKTLTLNSSNPFLTVFPQDSGYFNTSSKIEKIFPGTTYFNYTIMYGTIEFMNNGSNTYNVSCIFNSQSNINGKFCMQLPYGNYTFLVCSGSYLAVRQVNIQSNRTVLYLDFTQTSNNYSIYYVAKYAFYTAAIIGFAFYFTRRYYISFCPKCMEARKPFNFRTHRCWVDQNISIERKVVK